MEPGWLSPATRQVIAVALSEDLGQGDVTTDALIARDAWARGTIVARRDIVLAGVAVAAEVFRHVDRRIHIERRAADGDRVTAGAAVMTLRGPARGVLSAERTALNFMQRLSGIATLTRKFVDACREFPGVSIADTRKTTPGLRALEKAAVRAGGGKNHRFDLSSGVLIKDNHLALGDSIVGAIARARAHVPHGLKIEVEVDTLAQFDEALAACADIVLLDNFSVADIREAVLRAHAKPPSPLLEVSGGVTLATVRELASTGVDIISVGALTHSAPAVDLSMEIVKDTR